MKIEANFSTPVDRDATWKALADLAVVAQCMPGAALDSVVDAEHVEGRLVVSIGPLSLTYRGSAEFLELDEDSGSMVLRVEAKEMRGAGTASGTVTLAVRGEAEGTSCMITVDLTLTGRPAQFGRGIIQDITDRLIADFAANLSAVLSGEAASADIERGSLKLTHLVGPVLLRRGVPVLGAVLLVAALRWVLRRRRSRRRSS